MKQAPNRRPSVERGSTAVSRPNVRRRILYIITKATWGGAQRYVYDLATSLPKSQFEPFVACGRLGKLANDLIHSGVIGRHLPSLNRDIGIISDIKSFFEIREVIKELSPDVVHLNSSKAALLGVLAARACGVPNIIFTVHGWPFKEKRNLLMRILIYIASWFTAFFSHHVIVISKEDERLGRRMPGISKKIQYISLGIAPFKTLLPTEAFKNMFGTLPPAKFESSTLRLVTIGELTKNKGIRYAIDAVAKLKERGVDAIYAIVGSGELRSILEAHAKKVGISDRVFFPGFILNASQNLSGFDVFVLPSLKEGTPYVLLEAARAGIPSVATSAIDTSLANDIVHLRIVPTEDPIALADAIQEISTLPRSTERQEHLFSLSSMTSQHVALYER